MELEQQVASEESQGGRSKKQNKFIVIGAVLVAIVLIALVLLMTGVVSPPSSLQTAALVNGEKITEGDVKSRLQEVMALPQLEGVDINDETVRSSLRTQVLEDLVNTRLLLQAALAAGIVVSNENFEETYTNLVTQAGGEEALLEQIRPAGFTLGKFQEEVRKQLLLSGYIDAEILPEALLVTNVEIQNFYNNLDTSTGAIPPLADIRTQIEAQLQYQKRQEAITTLVALLKKDATIEIF